MAEVYLREIDAGTENACWVACAKGDTGAVLFRRAEPAERTSDEGGLGIWTVYEWPGPGGSW